MARESKIAHDYFLDCCKKYGVEVVSDKQVRSHFVTICKFEGVEHSVQNSIYGQGKERKSGMFYFKNMMASHYLYKEPRDLEGYDRWANNKEDILYTPKAKESALKEIYKLLNKALNLAKDSDDIPQEIYEEIANAHGLASRHLAERGE